jgi:hypothetical protein
MTRIEHRSGGCQCGSIRYQLSGEPLTLYACHCRDCQKQSSSAFGMSLIIPREQLKLLQGGARLKTWDTRGEDGAIDDAPISIKAGSLDDTRWLRPVAHIWLRSAQPWIAVDKDRYACFSTEADDEDALIALWQRQNSLN